MVKITNDCCDCAAPGYPCKGDSCHRRHTPHYYCDKCKQEFDAEELFVFDDEELCQECLLLEFPTVAQVNEG